MGQWNTLHVFDDRKFYQEVIPKMINDDEFLKKYINSKVAKIFTGSSDAAEIQIVKLRDFIKHLDEDFKSYSGNEVEIPYEINKLIEIIVFSECAIFSPYFKLGYRLFFSSIAFSKEEILAEEIMYNLVYGEESNIFSSNEGGIKSWISSEELELVIYDLEHLVPKETRAVYFEEFIQFIKEVHKHKLGLICCIDPREELYCYVNNINKKLTPFKTKMNFQNLLEIDCSENK